MPGSLSREDRRCLKLLEAGLGLFYDRPIEFETIDFQSGVCTVAIDGQVQSLVITQNDYDRVVFKMCGDSFTVHHEFGKAAASLTVFQGWDRTCGFTGKVTTTITDRMPLTTPS